MDYIKEINILNDAKNSTQEHIDAYYLKVVIPRREVTSKDFMTEQFEIEDQKAQKYKSVEF